MTFVPTLLQEVGDPLTNSTQEASNEGQANVDVAQHSGGA